VQACQNAKSMSVHSVGGGSPVLAASLVLVSALPLAPPVVSAPLAPPVVSAPLVEPVAGSGSGPEEPGSPVSPVLAMHWQGSKV